MRGRGEPPLLKARVVRMMRALMCKKSELFIPLDFANFNPSVILICRHKQKQIFSMVDVVIRFWKFC